MPKELTHWIAAKRTRQLLEDGRVKEAVSRHAHFYYLGAVVYDSPFYAMAIRNAARFQQIAKRLHGMDGSDTFHPFRSLFSSYRNNPPVEALSFICGAFTHYSLDVAFHPLVNYFSGKYPESDRVSSAVSQVRHRDFETFLDLYMCGKDAARPAGAQGAQANELGAQLDNRGRFSHTLRGVSGGNNMTPELVSRFFGTEEQSLPVFPVLKQHGLIQRQFYNRALARFLGFVRRFSGCTIAAVAASFYPAILLAKALRSPDHTFPFFASAMPYIHPNTGEKLRRSAVELVTRATRAAADLINGYQTALQNGDGGGYLSGERGLSLDYGCDALEHPVPRYFDTGTPILKLCSSPAGLA
ncbi:MAG: zinc dependent phospholipase C family protein [Spirochaetales bacterium]|nr:zinc dependent phospholipase C family protein [Spirochaetales bacterium]